MKQDISIHNGHRERLKEKIRKNGLKSLATHEVLEYLLSLSIPRKDTNPIAHNLLDQFGSLSNVLNADAKSLEAVNGIGNQTALFLSSIPALFDLYKEDSERIISICSVDDAVKFFRGKYQVNNIERFYLLCLNSTGKVLKSLVLNGQDATTITLDVKKFATLINAQNIKNIIIFHTHPNGSVEPSAEDLESTQRLVNICNMLSICLNDHIIFNENRHYSFGTHRILEQLNRNYYEAFGSSLSNLTKLKQTPKFDYTDNLENT